MDKRTPAPYGTVTDRWSCLDAAERDWHARRIVGAPVRDARIEWPVETTAIYYQRLVEAADAGDPEGLGWLATTHRPLLATRGLALLEDDPAEWGAVALELLVTAVHNRRPCGRWLRRSIVLFLSTRMARHIEAYLQHKHGECQLAPAVADRLGVEAPDPQPDLTADLARLLAALEPATRDGFLAVADHEHLADVAARYGVSHAALRRRMTRARITLQPELACYRQPA